MQKAYIKTNSIDKFGQSGLSFAVNEQGKQVTPSFVDYVSFQEWIKNTSGLAHIQKHEYVKDKYENSYL